MRKTIFLVFFSTVLCSVLVASDIPFFKSLFMGDEEYVKQELLKCNAVESVEIILSSYDAYDNDKTYNIFVHLTENRFIAFSSVKLQAYLRGSSNSNSFPSIRISQINDIVPLERALIPARINFVHNTAQYDFDLQSFHASHLIQALPELNMNNILDIINNFDAVYAYISLLPESSKDHPWFIHFEEDVPYTESFIIPDIFIDGVPFSITEYKNEHDFFDSKIEITWEYRYKFYKISVDRGMNEYGLSFLRTDYKSNYP